MAESQKFVKSQGRLDETASGDGIKASASQFSMNFSKTIQGEKRKSTGDSSESEPSPKKMGMQKISISLNKTKPLGEQVEETTKKPVVPIKMSLGVQKAKEPQPVVKKTSASVAQAFNADEESEEEEMPPECRMKMKNIGRETPTAAGPNSYGKGKLGFCDRQKIIQKELLRKINIANKEDS